MRLLSEIPEGRAYPVGLTEEERRVLRIALRRLSAEDVKGIDSDVLMAKLTHLTLGSVIEELIALRPNANQSELAKLAGCSRETVNRFLRSKQ